MLWIVVYHKQGFNTQVTVLYIFSHAHFKKKNIYLYLYMIFVDFSLHDGQQAKTNWKLKKISKQSSQRVSNLFYLFNRAAKLLRLLRQALYCRLGFPYSLCILSWQARNYRRHLSSVHALGAGMNHGITLCHPLKIPGCDPDFIQL